MAYEKCADVSPEIWHDLAERDPEEIVARTGVTYERGRYILPFLDRELRVDAAGRQVQVSGAPEADPGFRVCLTALLYLLKMDPGILGPAVSPLDLTGGVTFFRGHHGLPNAPLEARFGGDVPGFLAAGRKLRAENKAAGDAALMLQVFPGLLVEVILWQANEEFPAQATFALPAHLDKVWGLDAIWGLLNLVVQELLQAAASAA